MTDQHIGVLGATSLVGNYLLELLAEQCLQVSAFSRNSSAQSLQLQGVEWVQLDNDSTKANLENEYPDSPNRISRVRRGGNPCNEINAWICVAPIWVLPNHFSLLESYAIKRIVVLSSTSVFIKADSSDPFEKEVALRLSVGEEKLQAWAMSKGIDWVILRPTLIYGAGKDKNVAEIANFIRRFGFFPLFGAAQGLRQPVHAQDIATACLAALQSSNAVNRAYNLSGGETLNYREMVSRIFSSLGLQPRLVTIPLRFFRLGIAFLRLFPRYRHWTSAMAERMNQDLCFDHSEAARDFGYSPRIFEPYSYFR